MRDYFIDRNILLSYDTFVPVAEEVNFPALNVLDDLFFRRWRVATDTAEVDVSYLAAQTLGELVIRFPTMRDPTDTPHLFGVNDTVQIQLWDTTPAGNLILDTTVALDVDELGYAHVVLGQEYAHSYMRLTITAPDLIAAGGQLEIENIFCGVATIPRGNYNVGATDVPEDNTELSIGSFSGASIGEPRARWNSFQREWSVWRDDDFAWWASFGRRHGQTRSFIYVSRPTRPLLKRVIIARFNKEGEPTIIENQAGDAVIRATIIEKR